MTPDRRMEIQEGQKCNDIRLEKINLFIQDIVENITASWEYEHILLCHSFIMSIEKKFFDTFMKCLGTEI